MLAWFVGWPGLLWVVFTFGVVCQLGCLFCFVMPLVFWVCGWIDWLGLICTWMYVAIGWVWF